MTDRLKSWVKKSSRQKDSENQSLATKEHHNEVVNHTYPVYHETVSAEDWHKIALEQQVNTGAPDKIVKPVPSVPEVLPADNVRRDQQRFETNDVTLDSFPQHENAIKRKPLKGEYSTDKEVLFGHENIPAGLELRNIPVGLEVVENTEHDTNPRSYENSVKAPNKDYSDLIVNNHSDPNNVPLENRIGLLLHQYQQAKFVNNHDECEQILKSLLLLPISNNDRTKYTLELANISLRLAKWNEAYNLVEVVFVDQGDTLNSIKKRLYMAVSTLELGNLEASRAVCTGMLQTLQSDSRMQAASYAFISLLSRIAEAKGDEQEAKFYKSGLPANYKPYPLPQLEYGQFYENEAFKDMQLPQSTMSLFSDQPQPLLSMQPSPYAINPAMAHQYQQQPYPSGYGITSVYNGLQNPPYPGNSFPQLTTLTDAARELDLLSTTGFGNLFRRSPKPEKQRKSWFR